MSKPINVMVKVKVKYDQGHYGSLSSEFIGDRNLLDILIGFGVMAERLNPMSKFAVFWVFFDLPGPHRQKFKMLRTLLSNDLGFGGFCENLVEIGLTDPENFV